jgi:hypothetical protein
VAAVDGQWWAEESALFTSAAARARGTQPQVLRREVAAGRLVRIRRDAYLDAATWRELDPRGQHRRRIEAAARDLADPLFSHRSAAVLWGLPVLGAWTPQVHVTVGPAGGGRTRPGVVRHCTAVRVERAELGGLAVTSAARTVVDLARSEPFASGLMAADAALRAGLVSADELACELSAAGTGRGVRAARRVTAHASGAAESPGESLSRARMLELRAPAPVLQHAFRVRGRTIRVDFWWPDRKLVGEFDGRRKYRLDGVDDPRPVEDRLWDEKLREDALRGLGLRVLRWTWQEALSARRFADVLTRAALLP